MNYLGNPKSKFLAIREGKKTAFKVRNDGNHKGDSGANIKNFLLPGTTN